MECLEWRAWTFRRLVKITESTIYWRLTHLLQLMAQMGGGGGMPDFGGAGPSGGPDDDEEEDSDDDGPPPLEEAEPTK